MPRPNPITRDLITRGPGTLVYDGTQIDGRDGINAAIDTATQDVTTDALGKVDTIVTDKTGKVTFTPYGKVTDALLGILYPAYVRNVRKGIGRSIFPPDDKPLAIRSIVGKKVLFHNAALTRCPDLLLSPVKTAFGQGEFTAVLAKGKYPDEAGALVSTEDDEYFDFDSGAPMTGAVYAATYGDVAFKDTVDGWTVSVELQTQPVPADNLGTIDYMLTGVNVTARCTPVGLDEEAILAMLPVGAARGKSLVGPDLAIMGYGGPHVVLKNAALVRGPMQWGNTALRAGEFMFTANADTDGVLFDVSLPVLIPPPNPVPPPEP